MSEIAKWYSGKNILVTGATGFVGKCIVEKLLRDCPDVGNVYIIIRNKCGDDFERRKRDYTKHIVFDHLNEHRASALDKIKIVEGDLEAAQLGMSASDRKLIADSVSIVFHSAADVRFDRPMRIAYDINMRGTKRMLDFAAEFKHLDVSDLFSFAFSIFHSVRAATIAAAHHPPLIHRIFISACTGIRIRIDGIFTNARHDAGGTALRIDVRTRADGTHYR